MNFSLGSRQKFKYQVKKSGRHFVKQNPKGRETPERQYADYEFSPLGNTQQVQPQEQRRNVVATASSAGDTCMQGAFMTDCSLSR